MFVFVLVLVLVSVLVRVYVLASARNNLLANTLQRRRRIQLLQFSNPTAMMMLSVQHPPLTLKAQNALGPACLGDAYLLKQKGGKAKEVCWKKCTTAKTTGRTQTLSSIKTLVPDQVIRRG